MILFIRWILSICLAYPLSAQACRWYPIPINFNDERGQFNTSWTHCSKVVGNKSYALVTEKCMTQISAGVICYTPACPSTRLPSLRCIRAHAHTHTHMHVTCIAVRERDIVLMRDQNTTPRLSGQWGYDFFFPFFLSPSFILFFHPIFLYSILLKLMKFLFFFFWKSIANDTFVDFKFCKWKFGHFFCAKNIFLNYFYVSNYFMITHYDFTNWIWILFVEISFFRNRLQTTRF